MNQLYTETFGQGEKVVMLHGWAMHSGVWRTFAQNIAQHNQVTCIDLPGHGHSTACSSVELAVWAEAVLEAFPQEACHLIAWSLGGNIALELAKKYPNRIKSITLIASNPHFLKSAEWLGIAENVLAEFEDKLKIKVDATLFRFMTLQVQGGENIKQQLKEIKTVLQACTAPDLQVLESGLALLRSSDSRVALQSLSCPVQLILGSIDSLVPVGILNDCKLLQPRLECHIIEGAGHIPFITHKKETLDLVQNFLERIGTK